MAFDAAGAGRGTAGETRQRPEDWQPSRRPVEIVVPSAPGGGQDLAARTLQGVMQQLKVSPKPIIVTNKPGGGGTVSIAYIDTHAGDADYTVGPGPAPHHQPDHRRERDRPR